MKAESIKPRFSIFPFTLPSGTEVFRVTGVKRDGKQVRERCKTLEAATARQQELEAEYRGLEKTTRLVDTRLTPTQIADAEAAVKILGENYALNFVADWFKKNYRETAVKILLSDARAKFVSEKKEAKRRERTSSDLDTRLGQLVKKHPTKYVHEITRDDVLEIINKPPGAQTRKNLRTVFFSFFKWCVNLNYRADNPVDAIAVPDVEKGEVEIMPLPRFRALISAASEYKQGKMLPYTVLASLCAIRPEKEMRRLSKDWSEIDLQAKVIKITSKIAKKRGRRLVEIPDCAVEMLRPHLLKKTPIVGKNFRKDWDQVREIAGYGTPTKAKPQLQPWPQDVLRHTGISIHLALHGDENDTARWAGNSPDVIHNDYKGGFLTKKTAAEYYEVKLGGKILELKAA